MTAAVTASDLVVWALLAVGVGIVLVSCLGVLVFDDPFDALHFTSPPTVLAPAFFAVAAVIEIGPVEMGSAKVVLVAVLLFMTGPLIGHATARMFRIRERGGWQLRDEEIESAER